MTKVRRDDAPPPSNAQVSLEAAQNEFEAFQIVISGPATGIHIKTTALTGPGGTISPADCSVPGNIHVYREAFLQIASSTGNGSPQMPPPLSDNNGKGGWVPDALIPQVDEFDAQCRSQFYADVPVGQNQVLWVEVFVPGQGVPAGHYTGQVLLAWTGATACESATINVNLKVWNFPLPVTASLRSYFGSSTFAALPRQHAVAAPSASMSALVQRYAATGLDHRISMTNVDDGNTSDLNNYNNYYSSLLDGTQRLTRLRGAATTRVSFISGPKNQAASYNAFFDSFSGRPWLSNVFTYTVDEPPVNGRYCDIGPLGTSAHQSSYQVIPALITKDYDNLVAFQSAPPDCGTGTVSPYSIQPPAGGVADVNIMAPVIDVLDGNSSAGPANTRQKYNNFLTYASGSSQRLINDVWTYESCDTHGCVSYASNPSPAGGLQSNLWPSIGAVDHSLVRSRAMPWLAYYNDVRGVLYYDTLAAYSTGSQDPWHNLYYSGGNGDGTLFYPGTPAAIGGTTNVPVASLRLKMLREGMEDYEYMWLLQAAEDKSWAKGLITSVYPHGWLTDRSSTSVPTALLSARHQIACKVLSEKGIADPDCGTCVPGSSTPNLCGSICTNLQCDPRNCGQCNTICSSGVCTNGVCAPFACSACACGCNSTSTACYSRACPIHYVWDDTTCMCTQ
jgi:hypothetical protein